MRNRLPTCFAVIAAAMMFYFAAPAAPTMEPYAQSMETGSSGPSVSGFAPTEREGTPASSDLETSGENGQRLRCKDLPEVKGGTLFGYIIPCLAYTVEHGTVNFTAKMIEWLNPVFLAFLTFVTVMFGVKLVQGEGEAHKQGIALLMKIALVVMVLQMIPETAVPAVYAIMEESQEIVATTIVDASTEIHCEIDKYGDDLTPTVWKQMDCILGKLWGFTTGSDASTGEKRPNMLLGASMFGLLGGFLFGGSFGVALFFILVGVLWGLFHLVLRTAFAFMNAYLFAALMLIIAPLFMPLVLLRVTTEYFDRWWKGILAAMLLPVVIGAYAMFALLVYDKILLAPDSLMTQLLDHELIAPAQQLPRQACDRQLTNEPVLRSQISGLTEKLIYQNPFLQNIVNPMLSGGNSLCGAARLPVFQITDVNSPEFKDKQEAFTKLFREAAKLLILTFLLSKGFTNVQQAARRVLGSAAVGSTIEAATKGEQKFRTQVSEARRGMMEGVGGSSGGEFIQNLPQGFMGAFRRWTGAAGNPTD